MIILTNREKEIYCFRAYLLAKENNHNLKAWYYFMKHKYYDKKAQEEFNSGNGV